jgi:hypothetical protein
MSQISRFPQGASNTDSCLPSESQFFDGTKMVGVTPPADLAGTGTDGPKFTIRVKVAKGPGDIPPRGFRKFSAGYGML